MKRKRGLGAKRLCKESPLGVKRALQKGHFCSLLKRDGVQTHGPPSCMPVNALLIMIKLLTSLLYYRFVVVVVIIRPAHVVNGCSFYSFIYPKFLYPGLNSIMVIAFQ